MKRNILTTTFILINLSLGLCQSIKRQVHIPLDNLKGIPYAKVDGNFDVDNFDVDANGDYYFLSGNLNSSLIVKFEESKNIFRKTYKGYIGSKLYICNKKTFVLNPIKNNISVFTMEGLLIDKYNHFTSSNINSYRFVDSSLVIDIVKKSDAAAYDYDLYTLSGTKVKRINNPFNLPPIVFKNEQATTGVIYVGKWDNKYVFWSYDDKRSAYEKFWLANGEGEVLKIAYFLSKQLGMKFENEQGGKLRNGSIFVLGHNGKDGIVTELSPNVMFK